MKKEHEYRTDANGGLPAEMTASLENVFLHIVTRVNRNGLPMKHGDWFAAATAAKEKLNRWEEEGSIGRFYIGEEWIELATADDRKEDHHELQ